MTDINAQLAELQRRMQARDMRGAVTLADALLGQPTLPPAFRATVLTRRAQLHESARNFALAIADVEAAIALGDAATTTGDRGRLWNTLGLLHADAGANDSAVSAFTEATRLAPGYARAFNNLGHALRGSNRLQEAIDAYQRAVTADPGYALGWANLGAGLRDLGDYAAARTAVARALALDPQQRQAMLVLAGIEREASHLAAAAQLYASAAKLDPRDALAPFLLGGVLAEADQLSAARDAYRVARQRDPAMLRALLCEHLCLPMVAPDAAAMAQSRESFTAGLGELERTLPIEAAGKPADRVLDELRGSNFLLAYQGKDDSALQTRYANLVAATLTQAKVKWSRVAPQGQAGPGDSSPLASGRRVRVGFASAFFRDGTVGRYFEHWITDLSRERFEVVLYVLQNDTDALTRRLMDRADVVRLCPRWRPSQVAPLIHGDDLDLLVYPELGMDATTFVLAALRLAPVQCAGWGHPVTTGHATIDVFFSSAAMEPRDGQRHYTEQLITLPGIGTSYARPQIPIDATRAQFGLAEGVPLFLCPQSLFKIHPDSDALFASVLREVRNARLVFFEGRDPAITAALGARLDAAMAAAAVDTGERIHILPQCAHEDFLRINRVCTAMLDTLHWSGGNTSLDALACGLPIVTLPGQFMRGRQSAGMLQLVGATTLIARDEGEYVQIAARLARDPEWRDAQSRAIVGGHDQVFGTQAPLVAFASTLEALARGA